MDTHLGLSVGGLMVDSPGTKSEVPSDDPETDSEEERRIGGIWVFQYDAATKSLVNGGGQYVAVSDQSELDDLPVSVLTTNGGSPSIVYVVANVGSESWITAAQSATLDLLEAATIPNPEPVYANASGSWTIPMSGQTAGSVTVASGARIIVPVYRMFAKLMIGVPIGQADGYTATLYGLAVSKVPTTCRVSTIYDPGRIALAATFADGTEFMPWAYDAASVTPGDNKDYPYAIYVPENIQGEKADNSDPEYKYDNAPDNALRLTAYVNTVEEDGSVVTPPPHYSACPGGNNVDNYNVRRNCVYRVKMEVNPKALAPSANCLVASSATTIAFYPYYRDETGHMSDGSGGEVPTYADYYDFKNHLDPTGTTGKVIDHVDLIWQDPGTVGDLSAYPERLQLVPDTDDPMYTQIKVYAAKEGNALIAAYDSGGNIVWSWHIWVFNERPDRFSNAVEYTHYDWNGTEGILTNSRVIGYPIMRCNLGALANTPSGTGDTDTYGTLYQWGRKDPFPPMRRGKLSAPYNYDRTTGNVYVNDRSDSEIDLTNNDGSSSASGGTSVFYTVLTDNTNYISDQTTPKGGIEYSIEHPTVFIACAEAFENDSGVYNNIMNYRNQGDWLPGGGDGDLWGGNAEGMMEYPVCVLEVDGWEANLQDNYGAYKTIFDPCPYGWRISPGDLWLGFTDNGKNFNEDGADVDDETIGLHARVNCDVNKGRSDVQNDLGYYMYLTGWQTGETVFFPTQGSRWPSGQPARAGICGNYHNATVDKTTGVYFCNLTSNANYPYGSVSTSPSRFMDNSHYTKMDEAIRRVDILHMHCSSGTTAQMMCNPFEYQIVYYNRAVAGPVRCVRDTER